MSFTLQLREGSVEWQQVLSGVTTSNLFPSTLTEGVAFSAGAKGIKVHVGVVADATSGTSCTVALLGLVPAQGGMGATSAWVWLGSLNGGSSIAPLAAKWSASATRVAMVEQITAPAAYYERYTTLVVVGGTGTAVSTWVGIQRP